MTEPFADGVYAMTQMLVLELAVTNVQEVELKIPPAPPSLHDTVPVGVAGVPFVSFTVTVNAIVFPIMTDDGVGATFEVVTCPDTVSADGPELVL